MLSFFTNSVLLHSFSHHLFACYLCASLFIRAYLKGRDLREGQWEKEVIHLLVQRTRETTRTSLGLLGWQGPRHRTRTGSWTWTSTTWVADVAGSDFCAAPQCWPWYVHLLMLFIIQMTSESVYRVVGRENLKTVSCCRKMRPTVGADIREINVGQAGCVGHLFLSGWAGSGWLLSQTFAFLNLFKSQGNTFFFFLRCIYLFSRQSYLLFSLLSHFPDCSG